MASLIVEQGSVRRAGVLKGRVVIGRRANSHVVIPDRYVSRIHAWIGQADGNYFIADTGSRSGTRVNGQVIQGKHRLTDGDRIGIGPAMITFRTSGPLPLDAQEMDLSDRPTGSDDGIFMDCSCGAPLWAPWDFAGRVGQCRYCGQMLEMPAQKASGRAGDASSDTMVAGMAIGAAAASIGTSTIRKSRPSRTVRPSLFDSPEAGGAKSKKVEKEHKETLCGACQSPISLLEEVTRCPDCGVAFHSNCWTENRGCSSYGCKQVGILDSSSLEATKVRETSKEPAEEDLESQDHPAVQWEHILMPVALIASVIGMIAFGVPALLTGAAVMMLRARGQIAGRSKLVTGALGVCAVAVVAGFAFSWYWWLSAPVVPRAKL